MERLRLKKLDKQIEIKELFKNFTNSLFVPIRPDFRDSKSLLGYYNPLKSEYYSTPLLDFILQASKNYLEKGKKADPFFILFDEMNLARVEYYFADFLSVLEAKRFTNRDEALNNSQFLEYINYFGEDLTEENYKFTSQSIKLHNEENIDVPKGIFLPPNLYFVGTVNIDETTHMFSPKVLDRAFTIEFDVDSFKNYLEFLKNDLNSSELTTELKETLKDDFINNGEFTSINKEKIKEFLENNKINLNNEEKNIEDFLDNLNATLKRYNLHFGYRVFDEIIMFLYNSKSSVMQFENLNEALDLAIKMKVLPKFHGTRQRLEEPIKKFLKEIGIDEENINQLIKDGIPDLGEVSKKTSFKHTAHKLLEMLYKLKSQGFASYI